MRQAGLREYLILPVDREQAVLCDRGLQEVVKIAGVHFAGMKCELRRQIHSAIGNLSPNVRSAVLLALVEEEPYAEIASALGISVNAVKVRVFRGVRSLRKELSKLGVHA